jgi:hypothetical protein
MTTIKIRPAKPLDTSNLVRLLTAAHDESGSYPPVDPHMGLNWITRTLTEGYVIVADVSGRLVGTLALTKFNFPWSPDEFMYLEWLFVQKKFRKGGAFDALIKGCHAFADLHNAQILAGVSAGDKDVFLKDRLFQNEGYRYIGGDFIRSRHGQQEEENHTDVHTANVG